MGTARGSALEPMAERYLSKPAQPQLLGSCGELALRRMAHPLHDPREIERLWQSLREDLRKRGADPHTAEDVVQEAWLRAIERPPEERGRLSGWLRVVAMRLLYRTRRVNGARMDGEHWSARHDRASMDAAHEESTLLRYVDELPDAVRTVVQLRF